MDDVSRRRLLTAGGSGTALTLAGCLSFGDDDSETDPETGDGTAAADGDGSSGSNDEQETGNPQDGDGFAVTVAADIDEESSQEIRATLQEQQQEIQQQLDAGEIDQEEANAQVQEARQEAQESRLELIRESVGAIEDHAAGTEGIDVTETATDSGLLLVGGSAAPILGLLDLEMTAGILAEEQFEGLQQSGP